MTSRALFVLLFFTGCNTSGDPEVEDAGVDRARDDAAAVVATDLAGAQPTEADGGADLASTSSGKPMFVAIGKFGRITTSFDDGLTWSFNRSDDDTASCVGIDCDHHPGSATGITVGNGAFYASFGWGDNPSRIFRSEDGSTWTKIYDLSGFSFAGLTWTGDRLIGADAYPRYSSDEGVSFQMAPFPPYQIPNGEWPNGRGVGYAPYQGGRIAIVNGDGAATWGDTVISSDDGASYWHPTTYPDVCRGYARPPVWGKGVWLEPWAGSGQICRSTDGGDNWSTVQVGTSGDMTDVVFTGSEFFVYDGTTGYRSSDGQTWTSFTVNVPGGDLLGAVGVNPTTGVFVAVRGGWDVWYDKQRFYRSTNGVDWQELDAQSAVRSHPISRILFGSGK